MEKIKPYLSLIHSLSLLCLAGALAYFAYGLVSVASVAPDVMRFIDGNKQNLSPIVSEVISMRRVFEKALVEVEGVRQMIPGITSQVETISTQLPSAIKTMNESAMAVSRATSEARNLRTTTIPALLRESAEIRTFIPQVMKSGHSIIQEAHNVTKEAKALSEKAGSGLITGIIKAPFSMVYSLGSSFTSVFSSSSKNYSKDEIALITKSGEKVLASDIVGYTERWSYKKDSRSGFVTLSSFNTKSKCKQLEVVSYEKDNRFDSQLINLCLDAHQKWILKK